MNDFGKLAVALMILVCCNASSIFAQTQSPQTVSGKESGLPTPAENNSFAALSLSLNGIDSYLSVPYNESLNLSGSFTLEAWVKTENIVQSQTVLERRNENTGRAAYALKIENGKALFTICSGYRRCTSVSSAENLAPNVWQHVAGVLDGRQMRVYVNGQQAGKRTPYVYAPVSSYGDLRIGASFGAEPNYFRGLLDEVRVSNVALYNADFAPVAELTSSQSTMGLWRFDNGSVSDWSSHNNNATMNGSPTFSSEIPIVPTVAFRITPVPNVGPGAVLNDVKVVSPTDVWAVGERSAATYNFPRAAVALHWNGANWSNTPVPAPANAVSYKLLAVDASNSTNVWAVGEARVGSFTDFVFFVRWNGASWNLVQVVADPLYPEYSVAGIKSIKVLSENDIWAVGQRAGGYSWTLHWDGASFATVPSPNIDNFNQLQDVDATAPNDVWAVGSFIVIRWNGTEWQVVPNAPRSAHLKSVAVVAPNDVWAAGIVTVCGPFEGCSSYTQLVHFNGTQWTTVPNEGVAGNGSLNSISGTAPDNVWLVGRDNNNKTFVAHYDGTVWQRVASENTPPSDSDVDELLGVSAFSPTEVWAVGDASDLFYDPQGNRDIATPLALRRTFAP